MSVSILLGDCRDMLRTMPDESVHCVVTSPPYWGLRDYGISGQLGMEATYTEHVTAIADVFDEVRRVLRKDGTLWLNYGDSYATSVNGRSAADTKAVGNDDRTFRDKPFSTIQGVLKPKDLCGIPWRVAFALQERGWYLRQDIIWSKPNPMPESVRDRCTKAHEYVFMLSKSARYYYDADAIKEPGSENSHGSPNVNPGSKNAVRNDKGTLGQWPCPGKDKQRGHVRRHAGFNDRWDQMEREEQCSGMRNRRSVWTVATQPFKEAHFATFPPDLIEPCIKAGCPEKCCAKCGAPWVRDVETTHAQSRPTPRLNGDRNDAGRTQFIGASSITLGFSPSCKCESGAVPGTCLDPFGGAGTTGLVADRLQRNAILIELNPAYAAMAQSRCHGDAPMFAEVAFA